MPKEEAVELANIYRKQGYDDVHVERYHSIPTTDKIKNNKKSENMTAVDVPTVAYITDENKLSLSVDLNTLKGYEILKNGIKNSSDRALVQQAVDKARDLSNTIEGALAGEEPFPATYYRMCQEVIGLLTRIKGVV